MVVAVSDGVERGSECEAADRVREELARVACRGFLLVLQMRIGKVKPYFNGLLSIVYSIVNRFGVQPASRRKA